MTEGHVLENVKKDLEAGFDFVVTLLDSPTAVEESSEPSRLRTQENFHRPSF